jgi:hypothetical protein
MSKPFLHLVELALLRGQCILELGQSAVGPLPRGIRSAGGFPVEGIEALAGGRKLAFNPPFIR